MAKVALTPPSVHSTYGFTCGILLLPPIWRQGVLDLSTFGALFDSVS